MPDSTQDIQNLPDVLMALTLPVLLLCSAFFSGSETALFSLTGHQRLRFTRSKTLVGDTVATLFAETRSLLITLLLGNMTVNVLYFVISTVLLLRIEKRFTTHGAATNMLVGAMVITSLLVLILLGEVLPKMLASRLATNATRVIALPLLVVHRLLGPLRGVLNALVISPLARLFAPSTAPQQLSTEELETLLELSQQTGVIDRSEEQLLQQVIGLNTLKVRELMMPRVDIAAYDLEDDVHALYDLIREAKHSRIPVYKKDLDHVEGIVFARQVLLHRPQTHRQLKQLIRQVMYVPELQPADQLLVQLRKTGATLAIVVDEYGGTAGLVTLEDVVEEMVGQIASAHEQNEPAQVQLVEPGVWQVSADLPVRDWSDAFGKVGQVPGVSTIGGLVMTQLGRVPKVGDSITFGNVTFTVLHMDGRRIESLRVRLTDSNQPPAGKIAHRKDNATS